MTGTSSEIEIIIHPKKRGRRKQKRKEKEDTKAPRDLGKYLGKEKKEDNGANLFVCFSTGGGEYVHPVFVFLSFCCFS